MKSSADLYALDDALTTTLTGGGTERSGVDLTECPPADASGGTVG